MGLDNDKKKRVVLAAIYMQDNYSSFIIAIELLSFVVIINKII